MKGISCNFISGEQVPIYQELNQLKEPSMNKFVCVAAMAVSIIATSAQSQAFQAADLDIISEMSRTNEARFERDYKGKAFIDDLPFDSLERSLFGSGYSLFLGEGFFPDARCSISEDLAQKLIDKNPGDRINVRGIIDTTSLRTVILTHCRID